MSPNLPLQNLADKHVCDVDQANPRVVVGEINGSVVRQSVYIFDDPLHLSLDKLAVIVVGFL